MKPRPRIVMAFPQEKKTLILHTDEIERLRRIGDLSDEMPERCNAHEVSRIIAGADAAVTSWGSPKFTREVLDAAPGLRIIAHAAGTVKGLVTDEIWKRGIVLTSAAAANAFSVAQFTFSMMIFMLKNVDHQMRRVRDGQWLDDEKAMMFPTKEPYGITVGVVSASHCGRKFIELLQHLDVEVLLFDPHITGDEAAELGARKTTLEELMARSDVVSLHAPAVPSTDRMINRSNLGLMKDGALLLQTSRGSVIDQDDLVAELETGRIRACLDVTDAEPPPEESPLRKLPNVVLTPHLAGSMGNACRRMGKYAVDEIENFFSGKPLNYPVTKEMLARMA